MALTAQPMNGHLMILRGETAADTLCATPALNTSDLGRRLHMASFGRPFCFAMIAYDTFDHSVL